MKNNKLNLAAAIVLLVDAVVIIITELMWGNEVLRRLLAMLGFFPLLALIIFWWWPIGFAPQLAEGELSKTKDDKEMDWQNFLRRWGALGILIAASALLMFWLLNKF
ncbi:hypothetical protein COT94_02220 [Candidatus Falkowbacteria bacterium CG10_big_fil_rev_8_21_14_0_10_37_14]|uniref:Uncharacterized protein n=1 Tax=Candidatus Falkowbacteria bacterium CG10_big_fil_rev_8_21_14_0_10_37_14 TaxID=1974561 RepID=A0A2M6WTL9_9BACT|nr:hypothetical protein [Candidatus Falkowbacteria bacterium]PIT96056.1 MAG: hypothetical protein COT94_02220 [Candidatus Falkowbacteria bacterium CG10_big_fil_rev_8_21_14_0_10_37_14]